MVRGLGRFLSGIRFWASVLFLGAAAGARPLPAQWWCLLAEPPIAEPILAPLEPVCTPRFGPWGMIDVQPPPIIVDPRLCPPPTQPLPYCEPLPDPQLQPHQPQPIEASPRYWGKKFGDECEAKSDTFDDCIACVEGKCDDYFYTEDTQDDCYYEGVLSCWDLPTAGLFPPARAPRPLCGCDVEQDLRTELAAKLGRIRDEATDYTVPGANFYNRYGWENLVHWLPDDQSYLAQTQVTAFELDDGFNRILGSPNCELQGGQYWLHQNGLGGTWTFRGNPSITGNLYVRVTPVYGMKGIPPGGVTGVTAELLCDFKKSPNGRRPTTARRSWQSPDW